MNRSGMNSVWTIVISSAIIYTTLSILMGVIPGITMSHMAPTPGLKPYTRQERLGRDVDLTRSRGHFRSGGEGSTHGTKASSVLPSGVPS
jgi:cbb3-type cytochrome oxidase cytochrome c subunit